MSDHRDFRLAVPGPPFISKPNGPAPTHSALSTSVQSHLLSETWGTGLPCPLLTQRLVTARTLGATFLHPAAPLKESLVHKSRCIMIRGRENPQRECHSHSPSKSLAAQPQGLLRPQAPSLPPSKSSSISDPGTEDSPSPMATSQGPLPGLGFELLHVHSPSQVTCYSERGRSGPGWPLTPHSLTSEDLKLLKCKRGLGHADL